MKYFIRFTSIHVCLLLFIGASAQSVDLNKKTGLVKIDNKDAFYLIEKNASLGSWDYSLQSLTGEELAYLKMFSEQKYSQTIHQMMNDVFYTITFSKSGNYCNIRDLSGISLMKSLAKTIAGANIVVNNAVSEDAERKFIVMNKGVFYKDPNSNEKTVVNVNVGNQPSNAPAASAEIVLKENKIYNHSEQIGVYKNVSDSAVTKINIYKADGNKIAYAQHQNHDDNADWSVQIMSNNQTLSLLYDPSNSLEKLLKYLAEKGYFN